MRILIIFLTLFVIMGCQKESLAPYSGDNFVYFSAAKDSTNYSFAYVDLGRRVDTVNVWIRSGGQVADYDRKVKMVVKETNGIADVDYEALQDFYTITAGNTATVAQVVLIRTEAIKEVERFMVLALEETSDFKLNMESTPINNSNKTTSNLLHKIIFSEIMSPPRGWNNSNFGDFSVKKIDFICKELGMTRQMFDDVAYLQPRRVYIATKIANILRELEASANPVYESDGITLMRMGASY